MAAFLITLGSSSIPGDDAAFEVGAARLRSRRPGAERRGARADIRWAVISTDAEMHLNDTALSVIDAEPFMVEPHRATDSPTGAGYTGVHVDLRKGAAVLRRDMFGAKPLFYLRRGDGWAIASEAKMLMPFLNAHDVNRVALSDTVNYRWVLGADVLADPIRQVLAGGEVHLAPSRLSQTRAPRVPVFAPDSTRSFKYWAEETDAAVRASLRRAATEGEELSVLVSGGIDSSVLAGIAVSEGLKVRGYVVRFEGHPSPELDRSLAVAKWLGMEVEIVDVPEADLTTRLARMVWRLEQPPRNANNAAIERLFEAIARRDGVVVHGDGAEMMFGLADNFRLRNFARKRRALVTLIGFPPTPRRWISKYGPLNRRVKRVMDTSPWNFAREFDAIRYSPEARLILNSITRGRSPCPELNALIAEARVPTHEELQVYQTLSFLQCSLVRLDRIASPLGVPVAIPFLSDEVTAVARRLPASSKGRAGKGKPILRHLCSRYLPKEVAQWSKMGFQSPDRGWVAGLRAALRKRLESGGRGVAELLPADAINGLLKTDDYEAHWLLMTLDLALLQAADRTSADPSARAIGV